MNVDITEQRIRFEGYDVALDLSRLPPTVADRLVQGLQIAADTPASASQEEINEAEDDERKRVLDLVDTFLIKIEEAVDDESLKDVRKEVEALRKFVDEASS